MISTIPQQGLAAVGAAKARDLSSMARFSSGLPLLLSLFLLAGCGGGGGSTGSAGSGVAGSATTDATLGTVTDDTALDAARRRQQQTSTTTTSLAVTASGSGAVTSAPSGISCGSAGTTCSATYASNTSVTLNAQAATGYVFSQWGGACSGSASSCTVVPSSNSAVSATFSPVSTSTGSLTVTATGSGSVTSAPGGISCGNGATACSAPYSAATNVTLSAQPASGYAFSQWGGACSGVQTTCTVAMGTGAAVTATFAPVVAVSGAPSVLYTDVISGPTSGGEGNNGAYLSIFGTNFGSAGLGTTTKVFIGSAEVASYRFIGAAKGTGMQQITVQVGALGGAAQGTALPVKVSVGGVVSNTNVTFTPNPGRLLYVDNVAGNDATGVPGDITKPYRHVQTSSLTSGGAWPIVAPGDMIVMRGHGAANPWTDVGFENYFMRYANKSGSAPTGASGTGAIVLMGYPTEDVYIRGTLANGMSNGCVSAINGQTFTGKGQWAVISNLRIDCEGYDGPISQEIFGHNWRIVNNDLSASTAPRTGTSVPRMAGITGNGNNSFWYGNHIHDIQGSDQECHGIYIDGDGSYDIAYNNIHDIRDGNGFQVYVNGGNGTTVANNVSLHHNLIHDVSKHGVNLADGTKSNVKVWDNIVYNVALAGIRFNTTDLSGAKIFNNTFYNTNTAKNSNYGAITNDWAFPVGSLDLENNIFYVATGTPYNSGSNGVPNNAGTITHNLWFNGTGGTAMDTAAITSNPLFVTSGSDFHLQAGSPAIGVGTVSAAVTSLVTNDYEQTARSASSMDLGALKK